MKKDVWIKISGSFSSEGDDDKTELFTQGSYYKKNGSYYIAYDESEATGFAGCKTVLKVDSDDRVSLVRNGPSKAHLLIHRGERNIGHYNTLGGELMIGIHAHNVDVNLDDNGGDLHFQYAMDVNSAHISDNDVYVDVMAI